MGNSKFNNKMLRYFLNLNSDVKRFIHSKYIEAELDYYDFFNLFLPKYGIAIGIIVDIQNNSYRSYINFAPNNILNESLGEINLAKSISQDEANIVLAARLISIFDNSTYEDWI